MQNLAMKKLQFSLILFSLLGAAIAQAQTAVTTDPVGFTTINVTGNGGSGQPAYTFATLGMYNAVSFQSTTTSTGGSSTLVDPSTTWADNAYNGAAGAVSYFVEIISGTGAGTTYDIIGTTAASHSLTLSQPLIAGVASGDSYRIRPHWTIASVFGATNQNGLTGGSSTTADQILVWDPVAQGYTTYFYKTSGLGGTGWRTFASSSADASLAVLYPDDGFIIARNQSSSVTITVTGSVKTGQTSIPVPPGYTLLGNVYGTGMTLADSGLYTGNPATGVAGGSSTTADQILIWNPTTSGYDTYFYKTSGLGGTGWRSFNSASTDASTTPIPAGAALFINRIGGGGVGFNWVAPQHPASFN
jgi:uncharacterized protein (TIGR02597 family)